MFGGVLEDFFSFKMDPLVGSMFVDRRVSCFFEGALCVAGLKGNGK